MTASRIRDCTMLFRRKGSVNDRLGDDDDSDDDVEAKRENCTRWLMSTETAFVFFVDCGVLYWRVFEVFPRSPHMCEI